MARTVSMAVLADLLAEKQELHRRAIAEESDAAHDGAGPEERGAKLKEYLTFAYIGPTGNEPRCNWVELALSEAQRPEQGSGFYTLIDGTLEHGAQCATARFRDPRDRDPKAERSTEDEARRTINTSLEQARIGEERANQRADRAEAREQTCQTTIRQKEDEIRLLKDRIQKLEQKADDGGTLGVIFSTLAPFLEEGLGMLKAAQEKGTRRDKTSEKLATALDILGRFAGVVESSPGGANVMRSKAMRQLVEEVEETFGEDAEGEEETEAGDENAEPEPTPAPPTKPEPKPEPPAPSTITVAGPSTGHAVRQKILKPEIIDEDDDFEPSDPEQE